MEMMDIRILYDKDPVLANKIWILMEEREDDYPYYHLGWYDYVPVIVIQ